MITLFFLFFFTIFWFLTYIIRFSTLILLFFNALQSNPACTIDEGRKKDFSPLSLSIQRPKQLYSYTILGVNILTYDCKLNLCIVIFSGKNFNLIAVVADNTKYMAGVHTQFVLRYFLINDMLRIEFSPWINAAGREIISILTNDSWVSTNVILNI